MARLTSTILSGFEPVTEIKGGQSDYARGKHIVNKNPRNVSFNLCVADKMRGKSGSREDIKNFLANAAKDCGRGSGRKTR